MVILTLEQHIFDPSICNIILLILLGVYKIVSSCPVLYNQVCKLTGLWIKVRLGQVRSLKKKNAVYASKMRRLRHTRSEQSQRATAPNHTAGAGPKIPQIRITRPGPPQKCQGPEGAPKSDGSATHGRSRPQKMQNGSATHCRNRFKNATTP